MARIKITQRTVVAVTQSPWTFKRQTQVYAGQQWGAEITFPEYKKDKAAAIRAFVFALNGREGTFYLGDPDGATPQGSWGGTPLVKGAGQTGDTLIIDGLPTSVTGVALAGDYLQIGTRLHMVLFDANSNGSGEATLKVWPRLRESPADNSAVIYTNTVGIFALDSNINAVDINSESIHSIAISASEVI
jgi:hypothetical protein